MTRFRSVCVVLMMCLLGLGHAWAQAAKPAPEKTPADLKADAFIKLRDQPESPPTPARFAEVMGAGFAFLNEFPADRRTPGVVASMASYGTTIRDKKLAAQRAAWLPQLNFELLRESEGKRDEVRVALAALAASIAGQEAREAPSRGAASTFREKIDVLAAMPGSARFILDQERSYVQFMKQTSLSSGEKAATALLKHPDKAVVQMANDELNLIKLMREPIEFKGPALDGREVDLAQLRGKPLLIVFWATTNETSLKELAALKEVQATLKKQGFAIVTVCQNKDTEADAVAQTVKSAKLTWPVLFDGKGNKGEISQWLNVRSLPGSALFNASGTLISTGVRANRVEAEVKKTLGIK